LSKARVYELAKDYGMRGPEFADLLRSLGFDNIKSHMAVLDVPDQLMVVARLDAQGMTRGSEPPPPSDAHEDESEPGMPKKKALPPPVSQPPKKKLLETPMASPSAGRPLPTLSPTPPTAAASGAATPASVAPPAAPLRREPPRVEPGEPTAAAAKPALTPTPSPEPKPVPNRADAPRPPIELDAPAARRVEDATRVQQVNAGVRDPQQPRAERTAAPVEPAAKPEVRRPEATRQPHTAAPQTTPQAATPQAMAQTPARGPIQARPPLTPKAAQPTKPETNPALEAPARPDVPAKAATETPPQVAAAAAEAEVEIEAPVVPTTPRRDAAGQPPRPEQRPAAGVPVDKVKRLLVPQAKAQVVGRIELPQETIRDATRRSAPAADKNAGAAARLRRMALQNTQRGPAMRGRGGKGFAPPPRQGGRPGMGHQGGRRGSGPMVNDPKREIQIQPPVSVKALSEALGIKVNELLTTLQFKLNIKGKTINSFLTAEEVGYIGLAAERNIKIVEAKAAEDELLQALDTEAAESESHHRPPVVTFMGHVDHGKTSLLDALRESDVAENESGGITQHIGAYRIAHPSGAEFVVLDTPGHAAFSAMRARGAKLTDVVVLVVAADDGVMPQTEEAISHAKAAEVPIVVAINKCDKPGANPMQVMQQLAVKGLQPEEWGGTTQIAKVSAMTGEGLDELVEKIMLESEILDLKARPEAPASGVVVESKQSPREGVVLNVLILDGTLNVRDYVLCGNSYARVRDLIDDHGRKLKSAGPGTPVTLLGVDALPEPGEKFHVVTDQKKAREVTEERERRTRAFQLAQRSSAAVTLENLSERMAKKANEIKIIVKADVMGSLEPIKKCLGELNTEEVKVNIIHAGLGGITDSDVNLAAASNAIVVGFHTAPESTARQQAERSGVGIHLYEVIYDLIDDVKKLMEGTLEPEQVEKNQGFLEIRAVFKSSRFGTIAGCFVTEGSVFRSSKARLSRDGKLVYTGQVGSLRREKDDVREVKAGFECGLTLKDFDDVRIGDKIEFYEVSLVKRTLS
jgi:translation initiation factor IF-2